MLVEGTRWQWVHTFPTKRLNMRSLVAIEFVTPSFPSRFYFLLLLLLLFLFFFFVCLSTQHALLSIYKCFSPHLSKSFYIHLQVFLCHLKTRCPIHLTALPVSIIGQVSLSVLQTVTPPIIEPGSLTVVQNILRPDYNGFTNHLTILSLITLRLFEYY